MELWEDMSQEELDLCFIIIQTVCYWFCSLEEAMVYIRTLEFQHRVKFALRRTQKCDKEKRRTFGKVYWKEDGVPYIINKTTTFCSSTVNSTEVSPGDDCRRTIGKIQLHLAEVTTFMDYKIEDVRSRYGREIASKKLKDDNRSKEKLPTGECYIKYPAILPSAVTALVSEVASPRFFGDVQWTALFVDAMKIVHDHEIQTNSKYIRSSHYKSRPARVEITWDRTTYTPYVTVERYMMECHRGKDRNTEKNRKRKNVASHLPSLEAEAVVKAERAIWRSAANGEQTSSKKTAFCVQLPSLGDHSEHTAEGNEACAFQLPVDKRLVSKVHELVNDGLCNLREIQRALESFVCNDLFKNERVPEKPNRRFFPTKEDIRNHYNLAFSKRKLAKMDQENVSCLVDKWLSTGDVNDKMFFRQYIAGSDGIVSEVESSLLDENVPSVKANQTMLFVHQMAWQQRLLLRYGQDICLLDATYKTCKYALPLFFLCVKTNVNYVVAASFILQNETEADINEALQILKKWNPQWNPKYFMTDKCDAEIRAIETCFADCRVLICDFHREQAWERWTKKQENNVGSHREEILLLMRSVAKADDVETYKEAMSNLTSHECWQSNCKLRKYFTNIWLAEKERWMSLYRVDKLRVLVRTNNGVERQNRTLKQCHVRFRTDKSLSGLVSIIHQEFLPEAWQRYRYKNITASESYRSYNLSVPAYLRNRPTQLIRHCMTRMRSSSEVKENAVTRKANVFYVKSCSTEEVYSVTFDNPNSVPKCTCPDFHYHFLPCKHMFGIFRIYPDVSWLTLPEWYRESPFLILDDGIISTNEESVHIQDVSHDITAASSNHVGPNESVAVTDNLHDDPDKPNKKIIDRINGLMTEIRNISFDVTSRTVLEEAESKLQDIFKNLMSSCKHDAGLRIIADVEKKPPKLKRKNIYPCDALPRKYAKLNRFTKRYGQVTSRMRKLLLVNKQNPSCVQAQCHPPAEFRVSSVQVLGSKLASKTARNSPHQQQQSYVPITPHIASVKAARLDKCLLKNGPHSVSLLQLKSLESELSRGELAMLRVRDKQFRCGWLYDEIINSYLWCICESNKVCLYVSSMISQILEKGGKIKKLWENVDLTCKKFIFIPWNPSNFHWILIVVDIAQQKMMYLDPAEEPCVATSMYVARAKNIANVLLRKKLDSSVSTVECPRRLMQRDSSSCGGHVCLYAKIIADGKDLCPSWNSIKNFRKEIYSVLAGNCLKAKRKKENCFLCKDLDLPDWIACARCGQWMHSSCVQMTQAEAERAENFICPSMLCNEGR